VRDAARVAVGAVATELREFKTPPLVRFVLFDAATLQAYVDAAADLG
jgi:hypothetical protein